MLKNRGMRFLTSFLITIALVLLTWFLLGAFVSGAEQGESSDEVKLIMTCAVLASCVVGLVFQLLCDVLDFKILCGAVGTWIKTIIFIVLTAACFVIQFLVSFFSGQASYNFCTRMVLVGVGFSTTLTCFAFMIATSSDWDVERICFLTPVSVGAGLVLGAVYAGVTCIEMDDWLIISVGALFDIAILVAMVVWKIKVDGPFTDFGCGDGGYASSGSYSNGSRSTGSGRRSDDRMDGSSYDMDSAMRKVASRYNGSYSDGNDTLEMKVSYSGSGSKLEFYASATISLCDATKRSGGSFAQSQVDDLTRKYHSECERIQSEAKDAVNTLRLHRSGFDGEYRVVVHVGSPSIR